jgi:hypothetical protein
MISSLESWMSTQMARLNSVDWLERGILMTMPVVCATISK